MTGSLHAVGRPVVPAAVLALGLTLAGWFVGHGFLRARTAARYVEVKGLAEQEVAADLALWPLRFVTPATILRSLRPRSPETPERSLRF